MRGLAEEFAVQEQPATISIASYSCIIPALFMPFMSPKSSAWYAPSLAEWLDQTSDLAPLRAGMEQVASMESELPRWLPDYLAASVEPGLIKGETLALFVPNSALAARLRQMEPSLVAGLQSHGWRVNALRIRVRRPSQPMGAPRKQARISPAGLAAIQALSVALEPSPLRSALERMAARRQPSGDEQQPGA